MFLEKELEKRFCSKAKSYGLYPVKFHDDNRRGAPDRIILGAFGVCFFVEFKRLGFQPDKHQETYHDFLSGLGFVVHVCDSYQAIEDILDFYVL
jgi:hypothetical protein